MDATSISPFLFLGFCCLVSYAICSVPFGKIFAKSLANIDLQKVGSGNIGTTNALRAGGPKVAALTLACDVLKAVFCMNAALPLLSSNAVFACDISEFHPGGTYDYVLAVLGISCVVGHMFSFYLHFKGGKSIATGVGVLFAINVPWALLHLGIFIVLVAATKFVSVGSIVTAGLVGATACLLFPGASLAFKLIMGALGLLVVWAHRANIKKLLSGTESKLSFTKRVDKMDE
ncbi:MAG: glycerol-3-phosphate 1-O-acyltransferase PlsY [Coriobacteriaceae bacterium]|nr:glycerol-3-phosphate 1-O-acyltransferase PlsY [Coriobacteriaceae bacterium]